MLSAVDTLKVLHVLAGSVTAKMVDLVPFGNRAVMRPPDEPVEHLKVRVPAFPVVPVFVHSFVERDHAASFKLHEPDCCMLSHQ
jgi:hypothetical protein